MSFNNLSYAVIGVLLGLFVLALGQLVDCQNLAGATMALQCPNGTPISKANTCAAAYWPNLVLLYHQSPTEYQYSSRFRR